MTCDYDCASFNRSLKTFIDISLSIVTSEGFNFITLHPHPLLHNNIDKFTFGYFDQEATCSNNSQQQLVCESLQY